jgi:nitrogen fixation/metabolism regulation signal transduction histidine kinase
VYFNDEDYIIVTFTNVSELKQIDKLIFEKSKLESITEMLQSLSHQWKQPLSMITLSSTGLLVQQSTNNLNPKYLSKTCEDINIKAQNLSYEIDNFIKLAQNDTKSSFYLHDNIKHILSLHKTSLNLYNIETIINVEENILLHTSYNDLFKSLSNIIYSAIETIKTLQRKQNNYIFITALITDEKTIVINIKDNGGGIDESLIHTIFNPLPSLKLNTKTKEYGLYYSSIIIEKELGGKISLFNTKFKYRNESCIGTNIKISLPIMMEV